MSTSVPNLDCMDKEELRSIVERGVPSLAKDWFSWQPPSSGVVTQLIVSYVRWKLKGMDDRQKGLVSSAQECERSCDRIYEQLPEWARW